MITNFYITEEHVNKIKENIRYCPEGKLLGFHDRMSGTVNIQEVLPPGVPGIGCLRKVGSWGVDLNSAPSFPKPEEVFLHIDPESLEFKIYQVLSQGLKPIEDVEVIHSSPGPFQRMAGLFSVSALFKKKVVIVGMGSVGGIVTLELAKSGVGHFLLYDPDTLAVSNVCRHVGDIADVGRYKTHIIKEKILRRNPKAQVKTFEKNILQIDEDDIKQDWADVDLIIAATDNQEATFLLNQLAIDLGIPILWIGLYERASWGHILYSIPGETPCLACVLPSLAEIENLTPKEDRAIDYSSVKDITQIKAEPGLGTDIGFVSMAGAKIALSLLLKDDPTSTLKQALPSRRALLVVSNSPGSIFPETKAFQSIWVETSVQEDCEWCQRDRQYHERYGKGPAQLQSAIQGMVDGLPILREEKEGL